jgi:antitoxin VapB
MALSIEDPEADRLAREVARLTGESLTRAVRTALAEGLERVRRRPRKRRLADELDEIAKRCAASPETDSRSGDETLGYDGHGLPT